MSVFRLMRELIRGRKAASGQAVTTRISLHGTAARIPVIGAYGKALEKALLPQFRPGGAGHPPAQLGQAVDGRAGGAAAPGCPEARPLVRDIWQQREERVEAMLRLAGVNFVEIPASERARFEAALQLLHERLLGSAGPGSGG